MFTKFNYDRAVELLGKRDSKKLANNTYLHRINAHTLAVRLHNTDVVTLNGNGTYTLNTGGWRTYTTKDRINAYSPANVYQSNNIWYVGNGHVFHDGIVVDGNGEPTVETEKASDVVKAKRKLDKRVRAYILAYAADAVSKGGLTAPSNGDCWGCLFVGEDKGHAHANNPMGYDHLIQHMDENYFVPSLLVKAINSRGYAQPAVIWQLIDGEVKQGRTDTLVDVLSAYFRKLKPELLKLAA